MTPGRSLAIAAVVLLVTAAWLMLAPQRIGGWIAAWSPASGEAAFTVLIFVPLALLALAAGRTAGVSPVRIGSGVAMGAVLGIAGLALASGYAALAGIMRGGAVSVGLLPIIGIAIVFVQVAAEEVLFRGLLQPLLARVAGIGAVAIVAIAFGLLHGVAGGAGPLALVNMMLGGLLFGLLAWRGGGIGAAVAAHFAWNAAEQLLLGLDPNPGTGSFGALVDLDLVGTARWGGSAEGLNGSWAMTIALTALIVPLAMRAQRPAVRAASI